MGKSKRVKEFNISSLDGGMDVASDPITMDTSKALLIQNMEFDSEGERLITRRGLGSPMHTFDSDVYYIWYDYELNLYLIFLKNKNVYTYEYGKDPKLIGVLNGDTTNYPQITRYTNANGTYLLIASGETMQVYEYGGTSINTDAKYPECNTVMERFSRILTSNSGSNNIKYSGVACDSSGIVIESNIANNQFHKIDVDIVNITNDKVYSIKVYLSNSLANTYMQVTQVY